MATAVMNSTPADGYEVRVWGMDINDKPFIQSALARQVSVSGVVLEGVLPVKTGDTIGVQYLKNKARFKVISVKQEESSLQLKLDIECVESSNIWRFPFAIPIAKVGV